MAKNIKKLLKKHLLSGKSVTGLQALRWWKTFRLAVYVNRLRDDGYVVKTRMINNGERSYAKYHL